MKRIDVFEVFARVALSFSEHTEFDEIPNHFAEIRSFANAPIFENHRRHRPEMFERQLSATLAELLPRHVPTLTQLPLPKFDGMIQSLPKEKITVPMKTGVGLSENHNRVVEVQFLHGAWKRGN